MEQDGQNIGGSPDASGEPPLRHLRRWWSGRAVDPSRRLTALNRTLATYPDNVSGYVLRGEFYLTQRLYEQAVTDFQTALRLAERQLQTERWGMVEQVMRDRASIGLRRAQQASRQHRQQPLSEQDVYEDTR